MKQDEVETFGKSHGFDLSRRRAGWNARLRRHRASRAFTTRVPAAFNMSLPIRRR
jgi:hypothetical protein